MAADPITGVMSLAETAISRIWPDKNEQIKQKAFLEELRIKGDEALMMEHTKRLIAQMEVNKAEAAHSSLFVAGWRPFVGWVCGSTLAYQFVVYPLFLWLWSIADRQRTGKQG